MPSIITCTFRKGIRKGIFFARNSYFSCFPAGIFQWMWFAYVWFKGWAWMVSNEFNNFEWNFTKLNRISFKRFYSINYAGLFLKTYITLKFWRLNSDTIVNMIIVNCQEWKNNSKRSHDYSYSGSCDFYKPDQINCTLYIVDIVLVFLEYVFVLISNTHIQRTTTQNSCMILIVSIDYAV